MRDAIREGVRDGMHKAGLDGFFRDVGERNFFRGMAEAFQAAARAVDDSEDRATVSEQLRMCADAIHDALSDPEKLRALSEYIRTPQEPRA
jgi:hypothetical protein